MASSSTRLEIVQRAVKQAGRSAELYSHAKELLNDLLRDRATTVRYRELKKVESLTLPVGSSTLSLPAESSGMIDKLLLGTAKRPLTERETDDFYGPRSDAASACPSEFYVDLNARVIRFNTVADQSYAIELNHFIIPAAYALDDTDDNTHVWYSNDAALVQGLIFYVYQYMQDQREFLQEQRFERMDSKYRAGVLPMAAGSSRIRLSSRFK